MNKPPFAAANLRLTSTKVFVRELVVEAEIVGAVPGVDEGAAVEVDGDGVERDREHTSVAVFPRAQKGSQAAVSTVRCAQVGTAGTGISTRGLTCSR